MAAKHQHVNIRQPKELASMAPGFVIASRLVSWETKKANYIA
jgi:hypothetical protein